MKTKVIHLAAFAAIAVASFFTACKKAPESGASTDKRVESTVPARAEPDLSIPEKKVEITGNDQMKFDVLTIEAKPRQKVTVTLKNVGTFPKVSMGHNFVLLEKDQDPNKFVEAGTPHMGKDFIAPELAGKVIAHTKLLGPGESDTISFAAPKEPGAYTYICSFPGHLAIGMKGVLTVQ
jgi:azurin